MGWCCLLSVYYNGVSLFESYNRRVLESTAEVSHGEDQESDENQSGDVENQSGNVEEKDYETSFKYDSG